MPDSSVVSFRSELECIRAKLREGHLNAVREVLKDSDILAACREVGHEFRDRLLAPADDFVVELPVGKKHRREDPSLPRSVTVRLIHVEARVRGKFQSAWLATSLLDAAKYPAAEIARLYAGRWRIETIFRELKVASFADVLRSKTADGVRKELAARVMAVNLVRSVMIQAAAKHGKEPTRLSFWAALRLAVSTSLRMSTAPTRELGAFFELMLERATASEVPERPGRNEPRALTRGWKHYPHLRAPRAEWRRRHAA